ncbi:Rv3212 family protein [Actinomycetospora sp. CA-084318]|uniref:Rv3212 family protein n=1 Tax=Actinomycetospora sp. CA-084318 TaxID=3239892 RepID=UPI003D98470C
MSSAPPEQHAGAGSDDPAPSARRDTWWPRAERRRRGDLVVVALIVVVVVVGVVLVLRSGDEASTSLEQFRTIPSPDTAAVPTALTEAWRAADPAGVPPGPGLLGGPVSVGAAVATGRTEPDGTGVVTGLDAATGAVAWEYRRPDPLCTLGEGSGVVLALFRTESPVGTFCSDVASFDPNSGARGPSRNADVRPGTRLLADGSHVTATGRDYLEVWRDDLVATLEYGDLPTPVQSTPQPRAQCPHVSITVGADDVAVLERCPGEPSDRLSVLTSAPAEYDKPEDRFSVLSGVTGGRLVATGESRTALEAPDGTLRVYDAAGTPVATVPLGPAAGTIPDSTATDPPGQGLGVRLAGPVLLWWTGTATIGLDPSTLLPRWTLPGTLGPGAAVPTGVLGAPTTVLVPVPAGLAPVDAATGAVRPLIPVDRRADAPGPVGVDVVGATVVEQRGGTVVGLRPPG